MATSKSSGRHGPTPGLYQVHDQDTGLFMMVDGKEKQVIGPKLSPGPFEAVRIRETIEDALKESFLAASKEAARKLAEREAQARKAAAKPAKTAKTAKPAKKAVKKVAPPKDAVKRPRGRPPGMRSAKGTGNQTDAKEFSRRALAHRTAVAGHSH